MWNKKGIEGKKMGTYFFMRIHHSFLFFRVGLNINSVIKIEPNKCEQFMKYFTKYTEKIKKMQFKN